MEPYFKVVKSLTLSSENYLEDYLAGFTIKEDMGKGLELELTLDNSNNLFGRGGSKEITPQTFLEVDFGFIFDEFGEADYDAPVAHPGSGWQKRNFWPFRGMVLRAPQNCGSDEIMVKAYGMDTIFSHLYPECLNSIRSDRKIYHFIKGYINNSEVAPSPPLADALVYVPGVGSPFDDQLDVAGVVNDGGYIDYDFESINGIFSESVTKNVRKLSDAIAYHSLFGYNVVDDAGSPSWLARLYFQPRYWYGETFPNGTKTKYNTIEDLWTACVAGESSQWVKKHKFKLEDDSPSGDWSDFIDHDVRYSEERKFQKVTVYGKNTLGVIGVAGLSSGYIGEIQFSYDDLTNDRIAQIIADAEYQKLNDGIYEGTIQAELNRHTRLADPVLLHDSRLGWSGSNYITGQVLGLEHIYVPGEDLVSNIKIGRRDSVMDTMSRIAAKNYQISAMRIFTPSDTVITCPFSSYSDTLEMEDKFYLWRGPTDFLVETGENAFEIDLSWTKPDKQWHPSALGGLTPDNFDTYKLWWRLENLATYVRNSNNFVYNGYFDKNSAGCSALGSFDTEAITVTMDYADRDYGFAISAHWGDNVPTAYLNGESYPEQVKSGAEEE